MSQNTNVQDSHKNILVSDFKAAKKVMHEGRVFFVLPDLEKKFLSDFAVGKKVMREGLFFRSPDEKITNNKM